MEYQRPLAGDSGKSRVGSNGLGSTRRGFGSFSVFAASLKVRKQVYELTLEDLRKFPVWEFKWDEKGGIGQDESTVWPCPASGSLDPAERMLIVRTVFTLADGSTLQGYCSPPLRGDDSIGMVQPIIVTESGQVRFWCGTAAPDAKRLARNYAWLGKDVESVFPIRFQSDAEWVGPPITGRVAGFLVLEDFQTRRARTVV